MADEIIAHWRGLEDAKAQLRGFPDKLRRRALRNSLAAGARVVRGEAQAKAPVLQKLDKRRAKGTVRNAIKVRTSKQAKAQGNVGVFVNVQPAKGSARGTYKPTDPYYWRWLNFGRAGRAGQGARQRVARNKQAGTIGLRFRRALRAVSPLPALRFLEAGAAKLGDALRKIEQTLAPAVQRIADRLSND